jgi:hypothetical protein
MVDEVPHHLAEVDVQIVAPGDTVVSTPTRLSRRHYLQANLLRQVSRLSGGAIDRTGTGSNPLRNRLRTPRRIPHRILLHIPPRKPLRDPAQGIKNPIGSTRRNGLEMRVGTRTTGEVNGTRGTKETQETKEIREHKGTREAKETPETKGIKGARIRPLWLRGAITRGRRRLSKVCFFLLLNLAQ